MPRHQNPRQPNHVNVTSKASLTHNEFAWSHPTIKTTILNKNSFRKTPSSRREQNPRSEPNSKRPKSLANRSYTLRNGDWLAQIRAGGATNEQDNAGNTCMHWKQEVRKLWRQVRQIATKDGGQPVGKPEGTAERIGDSEGKDGFKGERGIYKVRRPGKSTVRDLLSDSDSRTRCSFLRETRVGE